MPQRKGYLSFLFPVAMLVFLPAAAGAGVVAAHLRAGALGFRLFFGKLISSLAHHVTRFGLIRFWRIPEWIGGIMGRLLRHIAQKIFKRHEARCTADNVMP